MKPLDEKASMAVKGARAYIKGVDEMLKQWETDPTASFDDLWLDLGAELCAELDKSCGKDQAAREHHLLLMIVALSYAASVPASVPE